VFYKSFLELNGSNFCSMLAFDSRSMQALLADKFSKYFTVTYPIFYQNKHNKGTYEKPKFFYRNAIDIALMANQSKAVQKIIDYIIKYQNNYISFFLFRANFPILLKKGITVGPLLKSKVFYFSFEMMEWPSIHTLTGTRLSATTSIQSSPFGSTT
jgi:hypothetical protein